MTKNNVRARLLASSMITSAAFLALTATTATAADAPATADQGANTELVVTGSRIPQPNLTSISPVTAVSSQEVKLQGTTRVEDLINNLPQAFADQGGGISNGGTGTADANLRNLGPSRTLVLIDGRRLVPGDPAFPFADLNFVPAALIDRVEVDTGGASAVYGSDAVAGVVNFIMKRDFEGVRLDANYSFYQHNNDNSIARDANARQAATGAPGFVPPSGSITDGRQVDITATIGANSPDGRGNVTGYVSYRHINPILQNHRDYSNCGFALNAAKTGFNCSGSALIPNGLFAAQLPGGTTTTTVTLDQNSPGKNTFRPFTGTGTDVYNFNPTNYYQRPDERYSAGFFAHYDINKYLQPYTEFMFMDDHTLAQIAPSPLNHTYTMNCSNPLMTSDQFDTLCGNQGLTPADTTRFFYGKRNVEGGPRIDDLRHTDYRAVIGLKGDLNDVWHYDVYGQYGTSIYNEQYKNEMSIERIGKALNVALDPRATVGGNPNPTFNTPQCLSFIDGSDPSCVPYNIFTIGAITPQQEAYVSATGFKEGSTTEQVVSGAITGSLGEYGIKSPWATDGVGVAFGGEYRRETLDLRVDREFETGDLAGQGAATLPKTGSFNVKEFFVEGRVPLIQDMPFAKSLGVELGYRFSDYSSAGHTNAYKVGGDWSINDDLRFRASYNRAVRAPNILELFAPQVVQLNFNNDPCAGPTPADTPAQCLNTGVPLARYGTLSANPANQYNGLTGGNPGLLPETADSYSVGAVLTPTFMHGASLTVDWYSIKVTNVIQGFGSQQILNTCATSGDPFLCGLVQRAPGTLSLWQGSDGFVVNTNQNSGFLKTSGIDFAANYNFNFHDMGMGEWGGIRLALLGTYTHEYKIQSSPKFALLDCVGLYGVTCQGSGTPMTAPTPKWRHKFRITWATPVEGLQISGNWRYIGEENVDTKIAGRADSHLPAFNYFDLAGSWTIKDSYTFRIGINNIFDKDPPLIASSELPSVVGNGNTFPQIYDALGRYVFMGVTADF